MVANKKTLESDRSHFEFMKNKSTSLDVYDLLSEKDIKLYCNFLDQIDKNNPFYKIELINVHTKEALVHHYFIYWINDEPAILMPFDLRQIIISDVKMPFYDVISPRGYSGPLLKKKSDKKILQSFWREVDNWYAKNNVVTEFIRFNFEDNQLYYTSNTIHALNNVRGKILEEDVLWNNYKYSVRKNYKNASKHELKFKMYHTNIDKSIIEEFYSIYIGTMDRTNADETFYYSFDYFENLISKNEQNCSLAIIYKDSNAISTELLLLSNNTMFSYLGGTNANYFDLRPNDFLKIETINWGRKQGFDYYLLGGGLENGDGLYQYKKKFFPNDPDVFFYTGRKIINKEVYSNLVNMMSKEKVVDNIYEADNVNSFFPKYRDIH